MWTGFLIGLSLGFVIGALAVQAGRVRDLTDTWRGMLDGVGRRLENDQTIHVEFSVGKYTCGDDDDEGKGDDVPKVPYQEFRLN